MSSPDASGSLQKELEDLIERYKEIWKMSLPEIIGCLEIIKLDHYEKTVCL